MNFRKKSANNYKSKYISTFRHRPKHYYQRKVVRVRVVLKTTSANFIKVKTIIIIIIIIK